MIKKNDLPAWWPSFQSEMKDAKRWFPSNKGLVEAMKAQCLNVERAFIMNTNSPYLLKDDIRGDNIERYALNVYMEILKLIVISVRLLEEGDAAHNYNRRKD